MRQYIANRGDTVSRIAALHGLTPEHVIQGNPWVGRQSYLYPGQVLFLPSSPRKRYAVQEGDTPERITSLFKVNLEDLEKLNPGVTSGRCCTPGKILVIPPPIPDRVVFLRGEYGPADVERTLTACLSNTRLYKQPQ